MKDATLKQAGKVLTLMENTSCEQLQKLLGSGLLSDLLSSDTERINREDFRKVCGLKPLVSQPVVQSWREQDGVIYFSVRTTGPQWIERLEKQGCKFWKEARHILNSPDFIPTSGVMYEIAVLKGVFWDDNQRTTNNIRAEAESRNLTKPNAEVACLIREKFTDAEIEAMGFTRIIAMHEPIEDSGGGPSLLCARRRGDGPWLDTAFGSPDDRWYRQFGFAFVVSQVSAQDSAPQN